MQERIKLPTFDYTEFKKVFRLDFIGLKCADFRRIESMINFGVKPYSFTPLCIDTSF